MAYVGLHVHSQGSFQDGLSTTDQMAQRAHELGQPSIAITDHGEVNQHLNHEKSCKKYGIKPILGMEGYLSHDIQAQKKAKERKNSHIVLLAEDNVGLSNLWAISTIAYREENHYYRPLADWPIFEQYHQGIIATSACMLSFMAQAILADDYDQCRYLVSKYQQTFGEDNFFLELHTWQIIDPQEDKHRQLNKDMTKINNGLVQLSHELSVPTIVVNDAHYSWPEQAENHQLVWALSTNADQVENRVAAAHIMGDEEVVKWMSFHGISRTETERAIANTAWIGERCNTEIERKQHMPRLTTSVKQDLQLFTDHIASGFEKKVIRAGLDEEVYAARVVEETDLIVEKNFYGYFNIVADYCKYAKSRTTMKEAWLVSPCRGSGGGSLVSYLMDITEVDPIKYDLLFSRFISPGRKGFPDIDLDFPQSKRDLLKDYFGRKYGADNVCGIGTLSRIHARSALRDVGRMMGVPYNESNIIAKIIDKVKGLDPTWEEIDKAVGEELRPWTIKYPELLTRVQQLHGLIRQSGTHAAGILISDESLLGKLPLRRKAGNTVTQFEDHECEELGYIKFDVLGVRHLDTLTEAWKIKNPKKEFDPNYFYDFTDAMYQDSQTWDRVATGDTLGIFQSETQLGSNTAKQFFPSSVVDMADLISVTRPGIIGAGLLPEYLNRRSGAKVVSYSHPILEKILERTFGICVYQEDVMKIVMQCAGYDSEDADRFRKMMGKKLYDQMKAEKGAFIENCAAHEPFVTGCGNKDPRQIARDVWDQIEAAGSYSFCKAHGVGYGMVSSWGAFMLAHDYPEYMTSCLMTDPKKTIDYIKSLRSHNVTILPPDINQSEKHFTLTTDGVRFGLSDIKHIGAVAQEDIIMNRPFYSLEDFLARTRRRACTSRTVEILIKVGAFETLGPRETHMRKFYEYEERLNEELPHFDDPSVIQDIEKTFLGMYVTSRPWDKYAPLVDDYCVATPEKIDEFEIGDEVNVRGYVTALKEITAKNGKMAFSEITCDDQVFPVVIFANKWSGLKNIIGLDVPVVCQTTKLEKGISMDTCIRMDWIIK